jgi:hypothetical protein
MAHDRCGATAGVSDTEIKDFKSSTICRLRLAAASGIPTSAGDVAEWLKAAVC